VFGGSKTQVTGHCFTDTVTTLTPFLMLILGLSATIRQCFRPKHYTETIFRLKLSISKGLGCSSIDKTMTRDLRFRPARLRSAIFPRAFTSTPACPDIENLIDRSCLRCYVRQILAAITSG